MSVFRPTDATQQQRQVAGAEAVAEQLPTVHLRDVTDADDAFLAALEAENADDPWDGYDDAPEDRLDGASYRGGRAVVERSDGSAIGAVSWIQVPHGPNRQSLAWSIGITIQVLYRGQRYGAAAQRLLCARLFATSEANRVEAETDVENVAERRALELAGFVFEGVARQANWRRGGWHDMAVYAALRADPRGPGPATDAPGERLELST